jgi:hypothetical protein
MLFIMHSPLMVWFYRQRWRVATLPTMTIVWRLYFRLWKRRRWRKFEREINRRIESQKVQIGFLLLPIFEAVLMAAEEVAP